MNQTLIDDVIARARKLEWGPGEHLRNSASASVMEALGWALGEWTTFPRDVPREIAELVRRVHDRIHPNQYAEIWTDSRLRAILTAPGGPEETQRRFEYGARAVREVWTRCGAERGLVRRYRTARSAVEKLEAIYGYPMPGAVFLDQYEETLYSITHAVNDVDYLDLPQVYKELHTGNAALAYLALLDTWCEL